MAMRMGLLVALVVASAGPVAAADKHRHAEAHEHGHARLNIAVEGQKVTMEFESPGDDIVGFERVARTPAETRAVDKAKAQLAEPLALFKPPAASGCTVAAPAVVEIEGEGAAKEAAQHTAFHATYVLDCKAPDTLTRLDVEYFKVFPRAKRLSVTILTPQGATERTLTARNPKLDLTNGR